MSYRLVPRQNSAFKIRGRGFTLIEVVVAISIAAIAIAVVPVAVERMLDGANYRGTVRDLIVSIRAARLSALRSGEPAGFFFNSRTREFGVGSKAAGRLPAGLTADVSVASALITPEGAAFIRFYPDGSSTGGSIILRRGDGSGVQLRVGWLLGRLSQHPV